MHNVSQEHAMEEMPLAAAERARFWRDPRFSGMECLSATFLTHEYSPHAHDTFSIGAIENGSQISTINGMREETGPGHLYMIDPGAVHDGTPGGAGYRYRMIYPDAALLMDVLEDVTGRSATGTPSFRSSMLRDLNLAAAFHIAHRRMEEPGGALEAEEGIFRVLTALFERHGRMIVAPLATREPTAAARARDFLAAHWDEDVGLDDLACVAGVSRAHLIRAFRREFHITPHAFLTDLRIRRARQFLRDGAAPAEVALDCGFADQAHFTRHFKARTGITPGQFRAR